MRPDRAMTRMLRAVAAAGLLALAPLAALAQATASVPAYSAEAVYVTADGTQSTGKVVKSGADMRLEFTDQGQAVVQIIRRAEGVMYVLNPAAQTYMVIRGAPDPNAAAQGYTPPCQQNTPGLTCQFVGNEVSSGITVEKWQIGQQGQPGSTILWDGARKRALRQDFPDGTVMAMAFKAMEQVNGRNAEHWTVTVTAPNQPPQTGDWYYDPELRVEIREVSTNGEQRSLQNIVVGPVDPAAFTVPAGWTEIAPPQQPPQQ